MYKHLIEIDQKLFQTLGFTVHNYRQEFEGSDYGACRFDLGNTPIVLRKSKITPKKVGQFVTLWKRDEKGETAPLHESDPFEVCIIYCSSGDAMRSGVFIFSKKVLIEKGIISTNKSSGKRGFRIYPVWDTPLSKQAQKTQDWQLRSFTFLDQKTSKVLFNNLINNSNHF